MTETKYTDKNGTIIGIGSRLQDEENFIWEVIEKDGKILIECQDLLAVENVYPRAKYCVVVQSL